jgi:hypothetical protein
MKNVSVMVAPGETATRILVMQTSDTSRDAILKARLLAEPAHPRALQWMLEAISLWQGEPVRAALCAGSPSRTCVTRFSQDWFTDFGNALYRLELVDPARRRVNRDAVGALGDFEDLKRVAR